MQQLIAGVDGCRGGWLAVVEHDRGLDALIAPDLETLLRRIPGALIGIDIPIGLPDRGSRSCDLQARRCLGGRAEAAYFRRLLGRVSQSRATADSAPCTEWSMGVA